MSLLAVAFGLMLVLEGALYALFPALMKRLMAQMTAQSEGALRIAGLTLAVAGFVVVWLVRR